VIASLVGTLAVLPPEDATRIRAFLINNFHGDPALFEEGVRYLVARTALPCAGVVPHFRTRRSCPAEDALALEPAGSAGGALHVAVPRLSRIANFDDLDPLRWSPTSELTIVQPGSALPGDADRHSPAGLEGDHCRPRLLPLQGWDTRSRGASAARGAGDRPVRRLSDAGARNP
jgi:adenosylcobyric acid synthase